MRTLPFAAILLALAALLVTGCGPDETLFCEASSDCDPGSFCDPSGVCQFAGDCTRDADCVYGSLCVDGTCRTTGRSETHAIVPSAALDLLFVVDDGPGMCDLHVENQRHLGAIVSDLAALPGDARLAVITTDMLDRAGGVGTFRRAPGTYDAAGCTDALPDLDACATLDSGVLDTADYDLGSAAGRSRMADDLGCLLMVGNTGSDVPMGLDAVRSALADPDQASALLQPGARLAVVFVSERNDCSDGTLGDSHGPVYAQIAAGAPADETCELQRNLEDSCTHTETAPGESLSFDRKVRTAWAWCVDGQRDAVTALADQLALDCPATDETCANALTPRRDLHDFLLELVAQKNGHGTDLDAARDDLTVLAHVNPDDGERLDAGEALAPVCGVGQRGYRYELFAHMFALQATGASCRFDQPQGWSSLFASDILLEVPHPTFCLGAQPLRCSPDDPNSCAAGARCEAHLADEPALAFFTCSNVLVRLWIDTGATREYLEEGTDYTVDFGSRRCAVTGSPVEITMQRKTAPGTLIGVEYYAQPQTAATP